MKEQAPTPNPYDPDKPAFDALQAQYAELGHRLRRAFNGRTGKWQYMASRWGHFKLMKSLDEVHDFLKQNGGGACSK